jgi:prepilin-type N-terminal cleavage/methylation domain-containing protein/prepilin-type processing-associated H-X9-DG protein
MACGMSLIMGGTIVRRARAFTLIELLTVMAIMAALIAMSMPTLSRTREEAKRTVCMANQRGIGHAFYLYAMNAPDPGVFPMIAQTSTATSSNMQIFNSVDRTMEPSTTGIPSPTVDMWAVVRVSYALPKQFICPSTTDAPDPMADSTVYYDFASAANLSYAYQYQHSPNRRTIGMSSEPVFPVLADSNPYIKGGIASPLISDRTGSGRGNSLNHTNREGQNVLYQDGHVEFEKGPDVGLSGLISAAVGKLSRGRDNCYSVHLFANPVDAGDAKPSVSGSPGSEIGACNLGDKSDACLVP